MLSVEDLTKTFKSLYAVDDVSMTLRRGEIHGLIGPNGAGKTTLVNLVTGELEPTSGSIRLDDEDITGLAPSTIARKGIGRSFQIVQYFPEMTVRDHLHLSTRDPSRTLSSVLRAGSADRERITSIAKRVHLDDHLDTAVKHLSHGQKRYLDIGMVLGLDANVLLFDEPGAGLNSAETEVLVGILESLRDDYTVMVIEHDIDLIRSITDRITVLHNGQVLATGTPSEIVNNDEVQEVYLGE